MIRMHPWSAWAAVRPLHGRPGITVSTIISVEPHHQLLWYDKRGHLRGIFVYSPSGILSSFGTLEPGEISFQVDPLFRRCGVCSQLLQKALALWPEIDLQRQRYTPDGQAFINKFLERAA